MTECPICGKYRCKALLGVFPIKICPDDGCSCVWGFWSGIAFWLADRMQPDNGGWTMLVYDGSYLSALWHTLFGVSK